MSRIWRMSVVVVATLASLFLIGCSRRIYDEDIPRNYIPTANYQKIDANLAIYFQPKVTIYDIICGDRSISTEKSIKRMIFSEFSNLFTNVHVISDTSTNNDESDLVVIVGTHSKYICLRPESMKRDRSRVQNIELEVKLSVTDTKEIISVIRQNQEADLSKTYFIETYQDSASNIFTALAALSVAVATSPVSVPAMELSHTNSMRDSTIETLDALVKSIGKRVSNSEKIRETAARYASLRQERNKVGLSQASTSNSKTDLGQRISASAPKPAEAASAAANVPTAPSSLPTASRPSDGRYALVIGNGDYRGLGRLRNPVNDARSVNAALRRLGFQVATVENASREAFARAILDHTARLSDGGTGIVFFAGHGMQVRGMNYLLPVEANPTRENELDIVAISLNWVLQSLADAGNAANIVILDACRNNPLQRQLAFRSASRGLAVVGRAPSNTLVLYATAPDTEAADGEGANSVFTAELVRNIEMPGLTVESMFKRVIAGVQRASSGAQVPWMTGSMTIDIVLKQ